MGKNKYRRLVDLYVTGTEFVLKDGTPLWLQVLNPFEREVVRREAQVAQARQILAMKEHGTEEHDRVKAGFYAEGRDAAVVHLVDGELTKGFGKVVDAIRNDPEWTERLEIFDRGQDDTAVLTTEEELLLKKIETDFYTEIGKRTQTERDFLMSKYEAFDDDALWESFLEMWLDRLGQQSAMEEYKVGQVAYAARACEGRQVDGAWDHSECGGHEERVWATYQEVRSLPESLMVELNTAIDALDMSEREAKNSDRQMSSSGSSQLPSEVEGSTPSTSTETPVAPRGTSSPPSDTPSQSTDGSNSLMMTSPLRASG